LSVAGFVIFMPTFRARLLFIQGQYGRAAAIYERLLRKNPARLKLYPLLAKIYLLEGRSDESALKVYKMILRRNFPFAEKHKINAIVAQKYLTAERSEADAIEVLESVLRNEIEQLSSNQLSFPE
jgi:tetratricopeptide (TPR) repeat protein